MTQNPPQSEVFPASTSVFRQGHLPALDGLRFIAVLLVIFDHGGLQHYGGDGVTYFFVLSGFLFATLLTRQWDRYGEISFRRFYFRRTMRIVPACYCCLLFTIFAKQLLSLPVDYAHALSAFTYTANYYNAFFDHPPTGFSFFWSLAVEEQFYLVWPVVFVACMHRSRRTLMAFLAITILIVCSWRSWLCLTHRAEVAWLYNAFDTRIDSIAIGCLLGLLVQSSRLEAILRRLSGHVLAPVLTFGILVSVHTWPETFHYSVGFSVESLLMGLIMIQLVMLSNRSCWKWLDWKPIRFLGVLSYSMYLYHAWGLAAGRMLGTGSLTLEVFAGVGFTVLLAFGSYSCIELPFQRLRDQWEPWIAADRQEQRTAIATNA